MGRERERGTIDKVNGETSDPEMICLIVVRAAIYLLLLLLYQGIPKNFYFFFLLSSLDSLR